MSYTKDHVMIKKNTNIVKVAQLTSHWGLKIMVSRKHLPGIGLNIFYRIFFGVAYCGAFNGSVLFYCRTDLIAFALLGLCIKI